MLYFHGREVFLTQAAQAGATLESVPITAQGPGGEELFMDFASLELDSAKRVLLVINGTHGSESAPGSFVQSTLLHEGVSVPEGCGVVFLHALNPYGFAFGRRVNENNVDLNRNFRSPDLEWPGLPDEVRGVLPLLNPKGEFVSREEFLLGLMGLGKDKALSLIAGQDADPEGCFYSGTELEESPRLLLEWVKRSLGHVDQIFGLESHTGIGDYMKDLVMLRLSDSCTRKDQLDLEFEGRLRYSARVSELGNRGADSPAEGVRRAIPHVQVDWAMQEFGTVGPLETLDAIRTENYYHRLDPLNLEHPAKQAMQAAFSPSAPEWRHAALHWGKDAFTRILRNLS